MLEPTIIYDYDPRNLPQDVLAGVGLIAAASAQTESVVEMGIAGCLGLDAIYGLAITTHMNAPLRDHVLRAVAEIRIDDLDALDELDKLLDNITAVFAKRNQYVHRTWCMHPETGAVFTASITARSIVDAELIPMPIDRIKRDATSIYDAGMALMSFLMKNELLAPLPKVPRDSAHKTKAARKKRREAMLKGK
jgi:hypothetical protein